MTPPSSPRPNRRILLTWSARVFLGAALGFAARMIWEREPHLRFATGLTLHALDGDDPSTQPGGRRSHLQDGVPMRFSLDEITAADDPAAALDRWCDAFSAADPATRERCLASPVAASATSLRKFLTQLATHGALRNALDHLVTTLTQGGICLPSQETMIRSFTELARVDPGLALDGAEASESDEIKQVVWSILAEDDPQRVLDLIASGTIPRDVIHDALASLAARSPDAAAAAVRGLPEEEQEAALNALTSAFAATDPVTALSYSLDDNGQTDPQWAGRLAYFVPITKARDFLFAIEMDHPELLRSGQPEVMTLVNRLAQRDPTVALRALAVIDGHLGSAIDGRMRRVIEIAATHDRAATIDLIEHWPEGEAQHSAIGEVAAQWLKLDAPAALQWLRQRPTSTQLLSFSISHRLTGGAWAHDLPADQAAEAAGWIAGQPAASAADQRVRISSIIELTSQVFAGDPAAACQWAGTLPDPETRAAATATALANWLRKDDGDAAAAILREHASRDPALVLATLDYHPWVIEDPRLESLFLEHLPALCARAADDPLTRNRLDACLGRMVENPALTNESLAAIARLPDPAWQQRLLQQVTPASRHDLSAWQPIAAAMPDASAGERLMEKAVSALFR